jgi:transposase InsO family protein
LPFSSSSIRALQPFDLIHCDLSTSSVSSVSGYKYYLVILDDCTHYSWTFPLRQKSDTFPTLSHFFTFVSTQFDRTIRSVQCDNGREFDNSSTHTFFLSRGIQLRMSCPYTSSQNGKVERMIRTTNDVMRSLLFQALLTARYWAESLYTATYILNLLPTKVISAPTTYFALFSTTPSYTHLQIFGCVY